MNTDTVNMININLSKERNVKSLKVVNHEINRNGNPEDVKCVEFVVIGRSSEWIDWMYYDDFKKYNPEKDI